MHEPPDSGTQAATPEQNKLSAEVSALRSDPDRKPATRYSLGNRINEGGMADIYEGTDGIFKRSIAIKFLKPDFARLNDYFQRFHTEALITGQLQHPAIVPVYDTGIWSDGRPFLTMKLVKGKTLKQLVDQGENRSELFRAFERICEAIGYAHEHEIVHRDLKPDNVMVGKFGEVLVMDWGLAKMLVNVPTDAAPKPADRSTIFDPRQQLTSDWTSGHVLGTPQYLAPEMADSAEAQPTTDVFGLGGILCYILTGQSVFLHSDGQRCWQQSKKRELDDVFKRLDATAELDWCSLAKDCLAADPQKRPQNGHAVAARANNIRKSVENKAKAVELANARAEAERAQIVIADQQLAFLLSLIDSEHPAPPASSDLFWKIIKGADATLQRGNVQLAELWYRKAHSIAEARASNTSDSNAQRDLSISYERLGDVTLQLGQTKEALEFYQKKLAIDLRLTEADPKNAEAQRDLSISYEKLGNVQLQLGQTKAALDFYEKGLAVRHRLADADPKNAEAQRDLSISYERLGDVQVQLGQTKAALDFYEKGLAVRQRLADADPKNAQAQRDLSLGYGKLGDVQLQLGQTKAALDFYEKGLAVSHRLADADPKNAEAQRDLSISFDKLGDVSLQLGQRKEALEFYQQGHVICQRLADADPKNAEAQRGLLISFYKFGTVHQKLEEYPTAIGWYEKALAVAAKFERPEFFANEVKIIKGLIGDCQANMPPPPKRRELAPPPRASKQASGGRKSTDSRSRTWRAVDVSPLILGRGRREKQWAYAHRSPRPLDMPTAVTS